MTAPPGPAGAPPWGRGLPGNRWDLLDGEWPATPPRVSVVVVHFRQPRELARTLAALARQTHPAERLEVLVVDDGSPEAPTVPAGVTLLRQEDRGFRAAAARNLGARAASGDVLVFLDADTTPEPGFVAELTRLPALAPEAVTVGLREHADLAGVPADAPIERAGPAHRLPAPAWLAEGYAASADLLHADDRSYRFVISAVLACSAWFFHEVGPFDEGADEYGGEDWEWAHRAWQAGALLAHVPTARAWHDGPDWAARGDDDAATARRAAKNREALRLADLVPVPGSRGHGVRSRCPDVLVELTAAGPSAATWLCVDALLAALPQAHVTVPTAALPLFAADLRITGPGPVHRCGGRARLRVEVRRNVRVRGGLGGAVERVAAEGLAALELTTAGGEVLVVVSSGRAAARVARWGDPGLFPTVREHAPWLEPIEGEPDLEAHLGGWG